MTIYVCFFAYCWVSLAFARRTRTSERDSAWWDLLDVFWPLTVALGFYLIFFTPWFPVERAKMLREWHK